MSRDVYGRSPTSTSDINVQSLTSSTSADRNSDSGSDDKVANESAKAKDEVQASSSADTNSSSSRGINSSNGSASDVQMASDSVLQSSRDFIKEAMQRNGNRGSAGPDDFKPVSDGNSAETFSKDSFSEMKANTTNRNSGSRYSSSSGELEILSKEDLERSRAFIREAEKKNGGFGARTNISTSQIVEKSRQFIREAEMSNGGLSQRRVQSQTDRLKQSRDFMNEAEKSNGHHDHHDPSVVRERMRTTQSSREGSDKILNKNENVQSTKSEVDPKDYASTKVVSSRNAAIAKQTPVRSIHYNRSRNLERTRSFNRDAEGSNGMSYNSNNPIDVRERMRRGRQYNENTD